MRLPAGLTLQAQSLSQDLRQPRAGLGRCAPDSDRNVLLWASRTSSRGFYIGVPATLARNARTLSEVTRRPISRPAPAFSRRLTPDKVLSVIRDRRFSRRNKLEWLELNASGSDLRRKVATLQ